MERRIESVDIETMDRIRARAEQLRAEAIRTSFVEFTAAVKRGFSALAHAVAIPKTEQL